MALVSIRSPRAIASDARADRSEPSLWAAWLRYFGTSHNMPWFQSLATYAAAWWANTRSPTRSTTYPSITRTSVVLVCRLLYPLKPVKLSGFVWHLEGGSDHEFTTSFSSAESLRPSSFLCPSRPSNPRRRRDRRQKILSVFGRFSRPRPKMQASRALWRSRSSGGRPMPSVSRS
jgi:hypothetical protein